MSSNYVHVYIPEKDKELNDWLIRLKRDNVVVTRTVRGVLRAHVRGEKQLTAEDVAIAVVRRLKEEGLVLGGSIGGSTEGEADLIEAALKKAAQEFT